MVTEYKHEQLDVVLDMMERMKAHLTAAIVSNDQRFRQKVLANTVNGTTYSGMRARTTGAPQNHWYTSNCLIALLFGLHFQSGLALRVILAVQALGRGKRFDWCGRATVR